MVPGSGLSGCVRLELLEAISLFLFGRVCYATVRSGKRYVPEPVVSCVANTVASCLVGQIVNYIEVIETLSSLLKMVTGVRKNPKKGI